MKALTDLFVRRPVLALVVNVVIIIAGLQAWRSLSVRQYPRSENASVTVATVYVGASADVVRGFVTTAIERSIASADGVEYVESKSLLGLSLVTARLKLNYDPTKALADITAKVNEVRNELPAEAEVPSISVQSADSQFAAVYLSFSSDALSQSEITDYLVRAIQPRLAALAGVQRGEIYGARTFAMRVWLKPAQMAALNVSPAQVRGALAANNYLAAVGSTKGAFVQVNLTANTDLHTTEDFKQLVIRRENDTIVRLQDVAEVELGAEDYDTEVRFNGQTAVFMGIFPLPNANTIEVVKRVRAEREERGFTGWVNHRFDRLRRAYGRVLDRTMRARPAVYAVWVLLSLMAVPMYMFSPKELAPVEDQGFMFGIINNAGNASADQKSHFGRAAEQVFLSAPERDLTFQLLLSPSDPFAAAQGIGGFSGMVVKPWKQRERSITQILPDMQAKLSAIPGLQIFAARPPALPGGGNFPVEFIIASTAEPARMLDFAQQLQRKAIESGVFYFPPEIDLKYDQPQSEIVIDYQKVATLGLNNGQIGADLAAALGGDYVNRFNIEGRAYKVIPQIARAARLNPDQLQDIYVTGPTNQLVPLSTVASIRDSTVPRSLNRFQQLNAIKLSGMTAQLDKGLKVLETAAREILPPGYTINYTGESRQLRTEGGKFLPALGLAIIMIFLVLAVQFNSFRDPFVILLGAVPLAMFGALLFTALKMPNPDIPYWTNGWTTTMNIYAQVGLVTLVGLVAKNGILIVEFANKLQERGRDKMSAIKEAAMTRLRPVLMTSVATVAGHFPLTLVSGPGAAARNSIGLVLVGGMTVGTIFTLFVVPSLYLLLAKQHSAERIAAPQPEAVEAMEPAALEASV